MNSSRALYCIHPMLGVPKGTFYYVQDCQHVKNEVFYVFTSGENVLDRVKWHMKA
jgi:hypothetical protein